MRVRAEHQHEMLQVENMLRGKPKEKFFFKPPPPPTYRVFIRKYLP